MDDELLLFSEWLDSQGLMAEPTDLRSHEDLVDEFRATRS